MTKPKTTPKPKVEEVTAIVPQESAATQLMVMIDKHANTMNVEKMRALLDMRKEVVAEEQRVAYSQAMRLCQAEMMPVVRKAENKHTRSKYAKLEAIDKAIRPIYTKHGFSLSFDSEERTCDEVVIFCDVMHEAGHTVKKRLQGKLDMTGAKGEANKTSIQGLGSTTSYLIRYLTVMIFNIILTDQDNDGNATGERPKPVDEFANAVKKEAAPAGNVSDADFVDVNDEWDGKYIETLGKRIKIPATGTMPKTGAELLRVITALETKADRDAVYNKNTGLIRALDKAGLGDLIAQMQTLVDNGA